MRLFAGTPFDIPPKCQRCGELEEICKCAPLPRFKPPEKQKANLRLEKRAKGKMVTVVAGLSPEESDLPALLTHLKNACGAGGSVKEGVIEIQGDHVERVRNLLKELRYRV